MNIKVTRRGEPLKDVEVRVLAQGSESGKTGVDGKVATKVEASKSSIAYVLIKGEGFTMGGGPYEVEPGKDLEIEV